MSVGGLVVILVVLAAAVALATRVTVSPEAEAALRALGFTRLDNECFTLDRRPAPTIFYMPNSPTGRHDLWIHERGQMARPGLNGVKLRARAAPALQVEWEKALEPGDREELERLLLPHQAALAALPGGEFTAEVVEGSYRVGLAWRHELGALTRHVGAAVALLKLLEQEVRAG